MQIFLVLLVGALVFGLCFLVDKGFTKLFRSQAQHKSGKAVRLSKRYGSFGLILLALGVAALFAGFSGSWLLIVCGIIIILMGVGLTVYYMSYAVFYDDHSFIFTTFGKKPVTYQYNQIQSQQLYNNQGHLLIELYMSDGNTVQLQSTMEGCAEFMDRAFAGWLRQTGRREEDCPFYDRSACRWFPSNDGEE